MSRTQSQPDLFAAAPVRERLFHYTLPDDLAAQRRPFIYEMLDKVTAATAFPWKNLTVATCEEMRFNALARLMPPAEGLKLLELYAAEIIRLYALIDEPWVPLYYMVLRQNYEA